MRYLRKGQVGLVYRALRERDRLATNAPHLVRSLPLVVPAYRWGERTWYGAGLKLYDALAWRRSLGRSCLLGRNKCRSHLSTLRTRKDSAGASSSTTGSSTTRAWGGRSYAPPPPSDA